jgi:hypothetical protein
MTMRHTTEQSVKYAGLIAFIPYHTLSKTFHKLRQSVAGAKRTLDSTTPFHPYVVRSFDLQFCLYFNSSS